MKTINQELTCHMEQNEYTLNDMLEMMYYYGVDFQVCWECWISRYGLPIAVDDPGNPKYGELGPK